MDKSVKIRQAVILAGGLGTRLCPLTDSLPKPMIPINGRPFLEYQIKLLKEKGVEEIILLLGYLPEKIMDYFKDGSRFGVSIKYSVGKIEDETGTRIKNASHLLDDLFFLLYCDNYLPFNLEKFLKFHFGHNALLTSTIYTNRDNSTKNNILVDDSGYVFVYDKTRTAENLNGVEAGFFIMDKKVIDLMPEHNFSFEKVIFPVLLKDKKMAGFMTDHKYYSIGSLERLPLTEKFLKPKKVIFLDRDGVINKKAARGEYIKNWKEFELLPGVIEAIKMLKENNYSIYIISNQAGIARKMMTTEDLEIIHDNSRKELQKNGTDIDGIYYCPHGWNEGCECRKPKTGMFFQAAKDHAIDLTKAVFIGDDERDLEAGEAADCKAFLVNQDFNLLKAVKSLIKQ
ncbi:MAG: D-glycero-D-manno-heptose 1,7-bisphosphate phosphatase [Parcubacteria group bacterium Athens1014_26]|nr:MAG: D-glycero-D-manno-heptose 1,7-bisphosphate phosphatase [Parcubacteria group bacterium Athens1014_26]